MSSVTSNSFKLPADRYADDAPGQPPAVAMLTRTWLKWVTIALLGYAIAGRGFAYIGLPPLFVAELLAIAGLGCLLTCGRWWVIFRMPQTIGLAVLFCWCGLRTIPYFKTYGLDAVRDAIIYLYGIFAFAIAGVIVCQPKLLVMLVHRYKIFFKIYLLSIPFLWMTFQFSNSGESLPHWPWASSVPILYLKAGDLQVHLGGIIAFWASEIGGATAILWFAPMFLNAAMLGPVNRGGMMAFLASIATSMIFKPLNRWAWGFILIAIFGLSFLMVTGISFKIPGSERPISADQLIENFVSVGGGGKGQMEELEGTKEWRLNFWHAIIKDTVYGPYFWSGKGFGINLVSDYGFQVDAEEAVRDPHNGHISMLARAGVPGLAIWIFVHLSWAFGMIDGYVRSRAAKRPQWAGLFMWLLIYWLMIVINCSFDPYIEGPPGGVWLWSIYGVGIAAMYLRGGHPDLFEPAAEDADEPDALTEMADV